jgi:hypothetical protein
MWQRVKAFCLGSTTIAWSYILAVVGFMLQIVDMYGDAINDPTIKDDMHALLGDSSLFARALLVIAFINIICRLRSLRKVV